MSKISQVTKATKVTNQDFFNERGIVFSQVSLSGATYNTNRKPEDVKILKDFSELKVCYEEGYGAPSFVLQNNKIVAIPSSACDDIGINTSLSQNDYCTTFMNIKNRSVEKLIDNTYAKGYETPSPVQQIATVELALGADSLIQSKSGTGKTFTFLYGLSWHFNPSNKKLQHVYITMTHEIAKQIHKHAIELLGTDTNISLFIGSKPPARNADNGGFKTQQKPNQYKSISQLINEAKKAQVVVCTLGKFFDLYKRDAFDFSSLKTVCIDEFDTIVDSSENRRSIHSEQLSTAKQIEIIMNEIPETTQRVFLSATVTPCSIERALQYFRPFDQSDEYDRPEPYIVLLDKDDLTLEGIKQYYIEYNSDQMRRECLIDILAGVRCKKIIIFTNKTKTADDLQLYLESEDISTSVIHGSLDNAQREEVDTQFKLLGSRILIATNVIARGYDTQDVSLVINYDMPESSETYIHRCGRAGRYGRMGTAISFAYVSHNLNELMKVNQINEFSGKNKMINGSEGIPFNKIF